MAHVYDKSKYHMGDGPQFAKSWEQASASAMFILRWMIERNLLSDFFDDPNAAKSLANYRAGEMTLFEFYEKECDLCLVDDQFTDEGNEFAQLYFDYDKGRYLQDLEQTLHPKPYPDYSEAAYAKIGPVIDQRYADWKRGGAAALSKPMSTGWRKWLGL